MHRSATAPLCVLLFLTASCSSKTEGTAPPGGAADAGAVAPAADAGDAADAGAPDLGIAPDAGDAPVACNPACGVGQRCRGGQCEALDLTRWSRRTIDRVVCDRGRGRATISPDRRLIAFLGTNAQSIPDDVVVIDAQTGEERLVVDASEPVFTFVSNTVVAVYRDRSRTSVELWDVATGAMSRELPVNPAVQGFGRDMVLSADGRLLGLSRFGLRPSPSAAEVWDLETGARRDMMPLADGDPHPWELDISPDGSTVQSLGGWVGKLASWDLATGQRGPTLDLPGFGRGLAWRPDGAELALAWHDDMQRDGVRVFDGLDGNELRSRPLNGEVLSGGLRFHPDAPDQLIIVTRDFQAAVTTAQVRSGDQLLLTWSEDVSGHGTGTDISVDGSMITTCIDGVIHIWEN